MAIKFALTASNLGIELVGQMCDAKKGLVSKASIGL